MAYIGEPGGDLTKLKQVGSRGKKARLKARSAIYKTEKEKVLLGQALEHLDNNNIKYFRIMEDEEWEFISWKAPNWLKIHLALNFGAWPDLFIMDKLSRYNKLLLVELKRYDEDMRQSQKKRAKGLNVEVCNNIDLFVELVTDFLES